MTSPLNAAKSVGIDTGEPTNGFYDHVRELPDVRADLGNAHLQAAAVAAELVITLDTVKKHVGHVLDKLGAANRTEAAARATTRPDQLARRPHRRPTCTFVPDAGGKRFHQQVHLRVTSTPPPPTYRPQNLQTQREGSS